MLAAQSIGDTSLLTGLTTSLPHHNQLNCLPVYNGRGVFVLRELIYRYNRLDIQGEKMKKIVPAILAIFLAACSFAASSEYNQNLDKWQDAKITHYRYTLSIGCFCAFREDMPVTVEVSNGEIVSIISANGSPMDATNPAYSSVEYYATMDRLFSQLKSVLDEADEVTTVYESHLRLPHFHLSRSDQRCCG